MKSSLRPIEYTPLVFSLIFHALFLFIALSLLYLFVILPIERNTFQDEIKNNIEKFDIDKKILDNLSKQTPNIQKPTVDLLNSDDTRDRLQRMNEYYSKPEPSTEITNKYLVALMIAVIIIFVLSIIIPYLFLRYSCNYPIPIGRIILENIGLFVLVASFEIAFFWYIARKYVPVQPTTLVNRIIENIKNWQL